MRVITGLAKGRRLKAPKGMDTRPTSDRVKEALFNILGQRVVDAEFLDLFAGTGSIGIEALSRGSRAVVFVERDPRAYKVILDNLNTVGFSKGVELYRQEVQKATIMLGKRKKAFDIVFIDPPYQKNLEKQTLDDLQKNNLLKPHSLVIVEGSTRDSLPKEVGILRLVREEIYGDTTLSFYEAFEGA